MAAAEKLVTQHLDQWTTAVKRRSTAGRGSSSRLELYGIKKLRELILELAVRGALVPQEPKDEPASELLRRIAAEKAKLVEDGKIKKDKSLPAITEDDKAFELPIGWEWAKLGMLMEMSNGRAFSQTEWSTEGLPIIRIQNLNDKNAPFNYFNGDVAESHYVETGTFLISWSGTPGTSFGAFIWSGAPGALNQHINKCMIFGAEINKQYLQLAVNGCMDHLIENAQGGVGLKHVTKGTLNNCVFAIPPLAEQARIVAKVNELTALCDQLVQQTDASLRAHRALVASLLNALTIAANHTQFASRWQRIAEHFDILFTTEESIDQLRRTILQLAVMGKLVPQDSTGEPADAIYSKSLDLPVGYQRTNKQKIKGNAGIAKVDLPPLPENWTRKTVDQLYASGHILDYEDGNHGSFYPRASDFAEDGVLFLTAAQISINGEIEWSECSRLDPEYAKKLTKGWSKPGDVYFTHNATVGRTAIAYNPPQDDFLLGTSVTLYRINQNSIDAEYLRLFLSSPDWYRQAAAVMQQTTRNQVSITKQALFTVSLPPLAEQRSIAAKVSDLNALLDQLKARLADAQTTQLLLADALTEHALQES